MVCWLEQPISSLRPGLNSPVKSYHKTLTNGIDSFPAWRLLQRDSVEKNPASLLVGHIRKAFNGIGRAESIRRDGSV